MKFLRAMIPTLVTASLLGCASPLPTVRPEALSSKPGFVPPSPIYMTKPELPPAVKAAGVRGTVLVEWLVGENGDVKEVKIIESPDHRLSALVSQAVLNWKFKPAMRDGEPVENRMRVAFSFG